MSCSEHRLGLANVRLNENPIVEANSSAWLRFFNIGDFFRSAY